MRSAAAACSCCLFCYWIYHFTCAALLYSQVLVNDDESLNLVNELGLKNLVAVRAPAPGTSTVASDNSEVAPELELTATVTDSSSEVDVYVIPESSEGSLVTGLSRREGQSFVLGLLQACTHCASRVCLCFCIFADARMHICYIRAQSRHLHPLLAPVTEDLQATTDEWLEPHATELADNFTATAQVPP